MNKTERVIEIIADIIGCDASTFSAGTLRDEVGDWDSLAHVQIVAELEDAFSCSISLEKVAGVSSVQDFIDLLP